MTSKIKKVLIICMLILLIGVLAGFWAYTENEKKDITKGADTRQDLRYIEYCLKGKRVLAIQNGVGSGYLYDFDEDGKPISCL